MTGPRRLWPNLPTIVQQRDRGRTLDRTVGDSDNIEFE